MSPTVDALKLPPTLTLRPREGNPLTTDERFVVTDRNGAVRAAIEVLRPDLLPN